MKKRPASSQTGRLREVIPTESLCLSVAAELGRSTDLDEPVVEMLCAALPYLEHEHPYQEHVFEMVCSALEQRDVALSSQVSESAAFLDEVSIAQGAVASQRAEVKRAVAALQEAELAMSQALADVAAITEARDREKQELEAAPVIKQALVSAIRDLYGPLKAGEFHRNPEPRYAEGKLAQLMDMVKPFLEVGLTRRVSQALRQEPWKRSAEEMTAVRQLGDDLGHQVAMLELAEMRRVAEAAQKVTDVAKAVACTEASSLIQSEDTASSQSAPLWTCPSCEEENKMKRDRCNNCHASRPVDTSSSAKAGKAPPHTVDHRVDEALPLAVGVAVRLRSLVGAAEFNGRWGVCEAWLEAEDRWRVHLDHGGYKNVKIENLEPQAALVDAQKRREVNAEAARAAEAELERCLSISRAGKKAREAADTAVAELTVFRKGPLCAFRELAERRGFRPSIVVDQGDGAQSGAESSSAASPALRGPRNLGGALSDAASSPKLANSPESSSATSKRMKMSPCKSASSRTPASPACASRPLRASVDGSLHWPMTP